MIKRMIAVLLTLFIAGTAGIDCYACLHRHKLFVCFKIIIHGKHLCTYEFLL